MQEENWVLVAQFQELFSSILKEENVSVVEWVSDLESVEGITSSLLSDLVNL